MSFSINLQPFHLRVISSFLLNVAAGLFLLLFTIRDVFVLTISVLLTMLFMLASLKIEEVLDNL